MGGVATQIQVCRATPTFPASHFVTRYFSLYRKVGFSMTLLIQLLVYGVFSGAIYALIALGYTMVYGIIELINFAHGDIFMIGSMVSIAIFNLLGIDQNSH